MISFWETQHFPLTLENSHWHMLSPTLDRDFQAKGSWSVLGDSQQVEADFFFFFMRKLFSLFKNNLFIYDCTGSSFLCGLFSSCKEWGLLSSCSMWASHPGGFSCCGATRCMGFSGCSSWSSSLTRDWTWGPLHWELGMLASGPTGKSWLLPSYRCMIHRAICLWLTLWFKLILLTYKYWGSRNR